MPLLSVEQVEDLITQARLRRACDRCGHAVAMDYCRSCDEFYWIHAAGCVMHEPKHFGHRLYLVPFVEMR